MPQLQKKRVILKDCAVVDLEEFPTQRLYPVYSIGSSVHAEIQCQLTINRMKEKKERYK